VGLPPELDIHQTPSLGLQLVNSLAGQLEGALEVDRQNGTAIQISFRGSLSGV
jgi:two-component sensor histidine kinase